ncbi:MAG: DUF167 domain-containing protein [Elusimicrobia bacterium]|nr:DUF167 domain-containing protein [Elusimicrobiota bacterium]MBI5622917.1 DUF167 domain-containing protein [Elusimicrobiota bacterium]
MIVKVRVIPNAPDNEVVSRIGSVLRVKVTAPANDDETNAVLKDYLAEFFEVPTRKVNILRGANGREKTVEIIGRTEEQLKRVMESIP